MPKRSNTSLTLSPTDIAVLVRIHDDPGIYAGAVARRMPEANHTWVTEVCRKLFNRKLVRRGTKYWARKGGYPRTPLFITQRGRKVLNANLRTMTGIELEAPK